MEPSSENKQNVRPAQGRIATALYRCQTAFKRDVRPVMPGCGKWITLTTRKRSGTKEKPWMGVCPYCGKKSRMRHREIEWFESRSDARSLALTRNMKLITGEEE